MRRLSVSFETVLFVRLVLVESRSVDSLDKSLRFPSTTVILAIGDGEIGGRVVSRGARRYRAVMAIAMCLVLLDECAGSGKDVGGDGNPHTGECKMEFDETVGGTHHRYPQMLNEELRLVFGKVIFTCDGRRPGTHNATASLEKRKAGVGAEWAVVDRQQSSRVPNPKEALVLRGTCDLGQIQLWRVHARVSGTITQSNGNVQPYESEDYGQQREIKCRDRR